MVRDGSTHYLKASSVGVTVIFATTQFQDRECPLTEERDEGEGQRYCRFPVFSVQPTTSWQKQQVGRVAPSA